MYTDQGHLFIITHHRVAWQNGRFHATQITRTQHVYIYLYTNKHKHVVHLLNKSLGEWWQQQQDDGDNVVSIFIWKVWHPRIDWKACSTADTKLRDSLKKNKDLYFDHNAMIPGQNPKQGTASSNSPRLHVWSHESKKDNSYMKCLLCLLKNWYPHF